MSKFVKIFGVYLVKIMICFLVHYCISLVILICFSQCLVHINIMLCRALWCQGRIMSLKWKFSFILHSLWLFCSIFIFLMLGISFIFLKFIYFSENISVLIKKLHLLSINCKLFLIWLLSLTFCLGWQILLINDSQLLMNFKRFHTLNDLQLISF